MGIIQSVRALQMQMFSGSRQVKSGSKVSLDRETSHGHPGLHFFF